MRIEKFNDYEKLYKKVYCLATKNICDKTQYFTTKKEAIEEFNKERRFYPERTHMVDLIVWNDKNKCYNIYERLLYLEYGG